MNRPSWATRHLRELWNPQQRPWRYTLLTILTAVAAAVPGNALFQLLQEQKWTTWQLLIGGVAVVLALILIVIVISVLADGLWQRLNYRPRGVRLAAGRVTPKSGLIAMVSYGNPANSPARQAIVYYLSQRRLRHVWLLHTRQPPHEPAAPDQSSHTIAHGIEWDYRGQVAVYLLAITDPNDPIEVFHLADRAYREAEELGLRPDEVVADITGGTKWMSIGVAYAGLPETRRLQYMEAPRTTGAGGYDPAGGVSRPVVIDVDAIEPARKAAGLRSDALRR